MCLKIRENFIRSCQICYHIIKRAIKFELDAILDGAGVTRKALFMENSELLDCRKTGRTRGLRNFWLD